MPSQIELAILSTLLEAIEKIMEYTSKFQSDKQFKEDSQAFDATLMNFIVLGEMTDKLSDDFIGKHNEVEWKKIYGLRNIIAHDYFGVYEREIWQIIKNDIPELKNKIKALLD